MHCYGYGYYRWYKSLNLHYMKTTWTKKLQRNNFRYISHEIDDSIVNMFEDYVEIKFARPTKVFNLHLFWLMPSEEFTIEYKARDDNTQQKWLTLLDWTTHPLFKPTWEYKQTIFYSQEFKFNYSFINEQMNMPYSYVEGNGFKIKSGNPIDYIVGCGNLFKKHPIDVNSLLQNPLSNLPRSMSKIRIRMRGRGYKIYNFMFYSIYDILGYTLNEYAIQIMTKERYNEEKLCLVDSEPFNTRQSLLEFLPCSSTNFINDRRELFYLYKNNSLKAQDKKKILYYFKDQSLSDEVMLINPLFLEHKQFYLKNLWFDRDLYMNTNDVNCISLGNTKGEDKIVFKVIADNSEALWNNKPELMLANNEKYWVSQYDLENIEIIFECEGCVGRHFNSVIIQFEKPALEFDIECFNKKFDIWYKVDSIEENTLKLYRSMLGARYCDSLKLILKKYTKEDNFVDSNQIQKAYYIRHVSITTGSLLAKHDKCNYEDTKYNLIMEPYLTLNDKDMELNKELVTNNSQFDGLISRATNTVLQMEYKLSEYNTDLQIATNYDNEFNANFCSNKKCLKFYKIKDKLNLIKLPDIQSELDSLNDKFRGIAMDGAKGEVKHIPAINCSELSTGGNPSGFYFVKNKCMTEAVKVHCEFKGPISTMLLVEKQNFDQIKAYKNLNIFQKRDYFTQFCRKKDMDYYTITTIEKYNKIMLILRYINILYSKSHGIILMMDYNCITTESCNEDYVTIGTMMNTRSIRMELSARYGLKIYKNSNKTNALVYHGGTFEYHDISRFYPSAMVCEKKEVGLTIAIDNCATSFSDAMSILSSRFKINLNVGTDYQVRVKCNMCPENDTNKVFGFNIYSEDSSLCKAVQQSGRYEIYNKKFMVSEISRVDHIMNLFRAGNDNGIASEKKVVNIPMHGFVIVAVDPPTCDATSFIQKSGSDSDELDMAIGDLRSLDSDQNNIGDKIRTDKGIINVTKLDNNNDNHDDFRQTSVKNIKINTNDLDVSHNSNESLTKDDSEMLDLLDTHQNKYEETQDYFVNNVADNNKDFFNRIKSTLKLINRDKEDRYEIHSQIHHFTEDGKFRFREEVLPVKSTEFTLQEAKDLATFKDFHPKIFYNERVKDLTHEEFKNKILSRIQSKALFQIRFKQSSYFSKELTSVDKGDDNYSIVDELLAYYKIGDGYGLMDTFNEYYKNEGDHMKKIQETYVVLKGGLSDLIKKWRDKMDMDNKSYSESFKRIPEGREKVDYYNLYSGLVKQNYVAIKNNIERTLEFLEWKYFMMHKHNKFFWNYESKYIQTKFEIIDKTNLTTKSRWYEYKDFESASNRMSISQGNKLLSKTEELVRNQMDTIMVSKYSIFYDSEIRLSMKVFESGEFGITFRFKDQFNYHVMIFNATHKTLDFKMVRAGKMNHLGSQALNEQVFMYFKTSPKWVEIVCIVSRYKISVMYKLPGKKHYIHRFYNYDFNYGKWGISCNYCEGIFINNLQVNTLPCFKATDTAEYQIQSPITGRFADALDRGVALVYDMYSTVAFEPIWKYEQSFWTGYKRALVQRSRVSNSKHSHLLPAHYLIVGFDDLKCRVFCETSIIVFNNDYRNSRYYLIFDFVSESNFKELYIHIMYNRLEVYVVHVSKKNKVLYKSIYTRLKNKEMMIEPYTWTKMWVKTLFKQTLIYLNKNLIFELKNNNEYGKYGFGSNGNIAMFREFKNIIAPEYRQIYRRFIYATDKQAVVDEQIARIEAQKKGVPLKTMMLKLKHKMEQEVEDKIYVNKMMEYKCSKYVNYDLRKGFCDKEDEFSKKCLHNFCEYCCRYSAEQVKLKYYSECESNCNSNQSYEYSCPEMEKCYTQTSQILKGNKFDKRVSLLNQCESCCLTEYTNSMRKLHKDVLQGCRNTCDDKFGKGNTMQDMVYNNMRTDL